jgi:Alpha/beta hydrolase domain
MSDLSRATGPSRVRVLRAIFLCATAMLAVPMMALGNGDDVAPFIESPPTVSPEIPLSVPNSAPYAQNLAGIQTLLPLVVGYSTREYFISGRANIYEFTPTGIRVVAPCPPSVTGVALPACWGLPYTTRMLVLAPIDHRRFSGRVWINPFNAASGADSAGVWHRQLDYFTRNGDILVGFTASASAVNRLKTNANTSGRYAELYWPVAPGRVLDAPYDGITYDIASQLGALFKKNGPDSPIHGYRVKGLFETGFSLDGGLVFNQANFFASLARMPDGGPTYDGYLSQGNAGAYSLNFGLTPNGGDGVFTGTATGRGFPLGSDDPRIKMQPRDVPVIKLNTEAEIASIDPVQYPIDWRRPDSNNPRDRYRAWEVPGSGHGDTSAAFDPAPAAGSPSGTANSCGHVTTNFPFRYVANAASEALAEWALRNEPPARVKPIEQTSLTAPTPMTINRDEFGNALGGVRTPYVEVPHSTYSPLDACFTAFRTPLSQTVLDSLYKSHKDYVRQFEVSAKQAVARRVWLEADAKAAIEGARASDIP